MAWCAKDSCGSMHMKDSTSKQVFLFSFWGYSFISTRLHLTYKKPTDFGVLHTSGHLLEYSHFRYWYWSLVPSLVNDACVNQHRAVSRFQERENLKQAFKCFLKGKIAGNILPSESYYEQACDRIEERSQSAPLFVVWIRVYSLKWRLTERYPRWGTLADPQPAGPWPISANRVNFCWKCASRVSRALECPRPLALARKKDDIPYFLEWLPLSINSPLSALTSKK